MCACFCICVLSLSYEDAVASSDVYWKTVELFQECLLENCRIVSGT